MTYEDDHYDHAANLAESIRRMRELDLEDARRASEKPYKPDSSSKSDSPNSQATPNPPPSEPRLTREELDQLAHDDAVEAARQRLQDMLHEETVDAAARRIAEIQRKEAERRAEVEREEARVRAERAAKEAAFKRPYIRTPGQERKWSSRDHPHYKALRKQEDTMRDEMEFARKAAQEAYDKGNKRGAKTWSSERKRCYEEVERLNAEASEFIFSLNNKDRPLGRVDLHGLYVKDASRYAERAILEARQRGDPKVHLIVGKGNRSQDKIAVIKPAMERLANSLGLVANLRPGNDGVLIVQLDDPTSRA